MLFYIPFLLANIEFAHDFLNFIMIWLIGGEQFHFSFNSDILNLLIKEKVIERIVASVLLFLSKVKINK